MLGDLIWKEWGNIPGLKVLSQNKYFLGKKEATEFLARTTLERRPQDQIFDAQVPSAVKGPPSLGFHLRGIFPQEAGDPCSEPLSTFSRVQDSRSFFLR